MAKTVLELQKAFQTVVNQIKKNKKVVALFTFGSIVSGDVWEESDIDLFLIYEDGFEKIRDVYSEVREVPVHTKILNKNSFLELYKNDGKKGFAKKLLCNSKLVFSRDNEISSAYNNSRYTMPSHTEVWNLVYLGKLLKDIGISKKYLQNGGLKTSYEVLIRTLDSFSKLLINLNGYTVTKDSLVMATNLSNNFKEVVDKLFMEAINEKIIKDTINYIEKFLDDNIVRASSALIDYLCEEYEYMNSYEISAYNAFKEFDIKMENILKELAKREVISKKSRALYDEEGNLILDENVYAHKVI
ncbi:nucleotidyltransferase domain-containing protein [Clostridium paraputrificum]|uniref:nucleotidyltransferase domain-containing protein n=1 Tax=Clostridium TaxID=1485 RepID=UPI00232E8190|nr:MULTISPECIES: nucleotidyltransferase domain-containing protein [Clostridium]MDB2088975.1 nucleotidyltransferase domain-containing protein [Clostridium paraputrificum]MDB2095415.1 nucleotidyltransferase domain-containing protein [Clostridium paraputrificum]MDU1179328.1 nucleotidyltransferase domain-containing protein [Clostridium sp.]MDU1226509.1 nucleotidyltransferase domain-containing protein [Clostridium sp.]MDU4319476.1 nucleotidyltransferase domain-containing protein [Clostridium sp.]